MTLLTAVLVLQVQILGLLHPREALVWPDGARAPLQARAGETYGARGFSVQVPGLPRRAYRGRLEVRAGEDALVLLNLVGLEEYVASVVGSELAGAPPAAQAALAVVARSYALAARASGHLCDTTHCQLYQGASRERETGTRGEVLLGREGVAPTLHSASCGGTTARARTVFPAASEADEEASAEIADEACARDRWTARLPEARLRAALHGEPLVTTEPGRLLLARSLGWATVPSPRFQIARRDGVVALSGSGRGHGVGLCQAGAIRLATKGWSAHQLLSRYFPRLHLGRR